MFAFLFKSEDCEDSGNAVKGVLKGLREKNKKESSSMILLHCCS